MRDRLALGLVEALEESVGGGGRGSLPEDRDALGGRRLPPVGLCDDVRAACAEIADERRAGADRPSMRSGRSSPARRRRWTPSGTTSRARARHVASYLLALDTINFGSGWFPTLNKRPGCSGYYTVAWALADHFRREGPWESGELRRIDQPTIALILGQDPGHELMGLYAEALQGPRALPRRPDRARRDRRRRRLGPGSRAQTSPHGMPFFDDHGFYKRAQIVPNDLALAGIAAVRRPRRAHDLRRQPRPARAPRRRRARIRRRARRGHRLRRAAAPGRRRARDPRLARCTPAS